MNENVALNVVSDFAAFRIPSFRQQRREELDHKLSVGRVSDLFDDQAAVRAALEGIGDRPVAVQSFPPVQPLGGVGLKLGIAAVDRLAIVVAVLGMTERERASLVVDSQDVELPGDGNEICEGIIPT